MPFAGVSAFSTPDWPGRRSSVGRSVWCVTPTTMPKAVCEASGTLSETMGGSRPPGPVLSPATPPGSASSSCRTGRGRAPWRPCAAARWRSPFRDCAPSSFSIVSGKQGTRRHRAPRTRTRPSCTPTWPAAGIPWRASAKPRTGPLGLRPSGVRAPRRVPLPTLRSLTVAAREPFPVMAGTTGATRLRSLLALRSPCGRSKSARGDLRSTPGGRCSPARALGAPTPLAPGGTPARARPGRRWR